MKIHNSKLLKMIAEGEHQHQDFKFCINDSRKIARSLVAFANSEGGRLLVGVKDNGVIAGVRSEEEFYMVEAAAKTYSNPQIDLDVRQWNFDGKTVLEVNVEASESRPHLAPSETGDWKAYQRCNDENIVANIVQLKAWELERDNLGLLISYSFELMVLMKYLLENSTITLSKFTKIAKITRSDAENRLAELLFLRMIIGNFNSIPINYSLDDSFDYDEFNSHYK